MASMKPPSVQKGTTRFPWSWRPAPRTNGGRGLGEGHWAEWAPLPRVGSQAEVYRWEEACPLECLERWSCLPYA